MRPKKSTQLSQCFLAGQVLWPDIWYHTKLQWSIPSEYHTELCGTYRQSMYTRNVYSGFHCQTLITLPTLVVLVGQGRSHCHRLDYQPSQVGNNPPMGQPWCYFTPSVFSFNRSPRRVPGCPLSRPSFLFDVSLECIKLIWTWYLRKHCWLSSD